MDSQVVTVLGAQWGDEGKGKLVDLLAKDAALVARYNGGANAGHTIKVDTEKFAFHLLPSGILYNSATCIIGNGVVFHVPSFLQELAMLDAYNARVADNKKIIYKGRIFISDRAHLLFDFHKVVDGKKEEAAKGTGDFIGTTRQGIGPCYSTKAARTNVRVGDLLFFEEIVPHKLRKLVEQAQQAFGGFEYDIEGEIERYRSYMETLKPMICDTVTYVNEALASGKKLLVESANAIMLDLDFGTYPFVTSSSPGIGGACTGLGVPPKRIADGKVIGIVKAYTTRVGEGPFVTEDLTSAGELLRTNGAEFGTTTGRPRRCGWLDIVQLKYSHLVNGYTDIAITKLDVLSGFDELKVCVAYRKPDGSALPSFPAQLETLRDVKAEWKVVPGWKEDITKARTFSELPQAAQDYCLLIEELMGVPVTWIGVGPERDAIITRNH